MQPLEKLLKDEIKTIFPRIKELVDIHSSFLEKLRDAIRPHSGSNRPKLSSVFIDFREKFLIYGDYCSKMTEATDTLRDVCKQSVAVEQLVAVRIENSFLESNFMTIFLTFFSNVKKITAAEKFNFVISFQSPCSAF
jgi:hypothetical protein